MSFGKSCKEFKASSVYIERDFKNERGLYKES